MKPPFAMAVLSLSLIGCSTVPSKKANFRISGILTDFQGQPLSSGEIILKSPDFSNAVVTMTDADGRFMIDAPRGQYRALYACEGYRSKHFESWYWDIPSETDHELQIRIDGLEVYGIKAWRNVAGAIVYFRPM